MIVPTHRGTSPARLRLPKLLLGAHRRSQEAPGCQSYTIARLLNLLARMARIAAGSRAAPSRMRKGARYPAWV